MTASHSPTAGQSTDTSPHSVGPALSGEMAATSDKNKRYDRGIRVWGAHGQEALEAASVCLLNAGPTGTEALKNLVLGGIHSFTVVDGAKVTPADLGNNFLLTADGLAASRAQVATGERECGADVWAGRNTRDAMDLSYSAPHRGPCGHGVLPEWAVSGRALVLHPGRAGSRRGTKGSARSCATPEQPGAARARLS